MRQASQIVAASLTSRKAWRSFSAPFMVGTLPVDALLQLRVYLIPRLPTYLSECPLRVSTMPITAPNPNPRPKNAERAERMLFDLMFGVVDQIFGGAAALFKPAFRRVDPIFDCVSDSTFHALNSRFKLRGGDSDICYFIEQWVFHCCSSMLILSLKRARRASRLFSAAAIFAFGPNVGVPDDVI
jgi:hypothetical protein